LPDHVPLAQPDLLARYKTALRYIAERAPTIDDARRVAAEALEGRVDHTTVEHTTVEHTAEVQPEAASSEIDNIETGVTDEQLAAVTDYVARTTKRPRQVNIATSSPTNADKLDQAPGTCWWLMSTGTLGEEGRTGPTTTAPSRVRE
jgi:hypothetical protein